MSPSTGVFKGLFIEDLHRFLKRSILVHDLFLWMGFLSYMTSYTGLFIEIWQKICYPKGIYKWFQFQRRPLNSLLIIEYLWKLFLVLDSWPFSTEKITKTKKITKTTFKENILNQGLSNLDFSQFLWTFMAPNRDF